MKNKKLNTFHNLSGGGKKLHIEALRIIACFCVIVNHTNSVIFQNVEISNLWYLSITYFFISKIAVPIFLLIMGAVLLGKQDSYDKYKKRIFRFVAVLIIFSAVNYIFKYHDANMTLYHFFKCLFGSVTNAYWYLYLYLGLLIMLPLLQKIAHSLAKREIELFLFISLVIAGTVPMLQIFIDLKVNNSFLVALFSPYLGLMFAGYYIETYVKLNKKIVLIACGTFIGLILIQVAITTGLYHNNPKSYLQLDNRTFITITAASLCVYMIVKYLFSIGTVPEGMRRFIIYCGGLTFGIYLLSDMSIVLLRPLYLTLKSDMWIFGAMILYEICIFIIGAICTIVLKKIPYIKKLL